MIEVINELILVLLGLIIFAAGLVYYKTKKEHAKTAHLLYKGRQFYVKRKRKGKRRY